MRSWNLSDLTKSSPSIRRILEINPGQPLAYYQMGQANFAAQRYEEAIAALSTALETVPFMIEALILLAAAYQATGRIADAIQQYEEVLEVEPEHCEALEALQRLQP